MIPKITLSDYYKSPNEERVAYEAPIIFNSSIKERAESILANANFEILAETQEFVKNRYLIPLLTGLKQVDRAQAFECLSAQRETIEKLIALIDTIDFSMGYENPKRKFPSNAQLQEIVSTTLELKTLYDSYKSLKEFSLQFDAQFKPFLDHLEKQIRMHALSSREAELEGLNVEKDAEQEFKMAVTKSNIEALKESPGQHWRELRDLLNLNQSPNRSRVATQSELEFFQFITTIYDRLNATAEPAKMSLTRP